ncbi:hypothetical protein GQ53DRAFT_748033 [Thozetella sp. PMI_491]|nr:hypothetical protein GQ53DRAFT_748033 [Thozetella sp. PMI_491]
MANLKRKRTLSVAPSSFVGFRSHSQLPPESINPLSHPPLLLSQFAVAGYPENHPRPAEIYPGFPHRPLPYDRGLAQGDEVLERRGEGESEGEGHEGEDDGLGQAQAQTEAWEHTRIAAERRSKRYEKHLSGLIGVIQAGLEEGDILRAKRAFGLLMRREIKGKQVDLRHNGLWVVGAEILLREGETPDDYMTATGERKRRVPTAWNMAKVRNYYEGLIRQYPYNRLHQDSISARQFYPAMFAIEMDYVYSAHMAGLEELGEESWSLPNESRRGPMELDQPGFYDMDRPRPGYEDPYHPAFGYEQHDDDGLPTGVKADPGAPSAAVRAQRNQLRTQALNRMLEITERMDHAMENAPFGTDHEMLRLRAMVALYTADLSIPPPPRGMDEEAKGRKERVAHWRRARELFEKIIEDGGGFEEDWISDFIAEGDPGTSDEEQEEHEHTQAKWYEGARRGPSIYDF